MQNKNNTKQVLSGIIVALIAVNAQANISTTAYDYDLDAGTTTMTDANNRQVISYYDIVNRLDKIELPDMDGGLQSFDFDYDETDQLISATYPSGTQTFTYDDLDRMDSLSEFGITDLLKFEYDHQDRVTAIIYGNNNGAVCYQYDPDGRLTKVGRSFTGQSAENCKDADVEWTSYVYDSKGRLDTRTYPNGLKSYWDYSTTTGQIEQIGHQKADGSLIYSDTFIYYPGSNLYESVSRSTQDSLSKTSYVYDAYQRLTEVTEPSGRHTLFEYDAFSNRTYETITNPNAASNTAKADGVYRYVYDGNRLSDIYYTPPQGAEQITALESFTYDNVGRIETRIHSISGLTTYTWDDRGYLISLVSPSITASYAYNALGARVSKIVNGVTTQYVTAPVFGMNHVLMELDASNNVTGRYVYGGHQQLIQETNPNNNAQDQYLLHGGSVGNVTHAMGRAQDVVNEYAYDAFGARAVVSGDEGTSFGYTGEQYDDETGLLYLRARYYAPLLGRFITVDPYLGRMAEPVTQNRYVYVHGNPVSFVDPSGLTGATILTTFMRSIGVDDVTVNLGASVNIPLLGSGVSGGMAADTSGNAGFYFSVAPAMNSVIVDTLDQITGQNKSDDFKNMGGGLDINKFTIDMGLQLGDLPSQAGNKSEAFAGAGAFGMTINENSGNIGGGEFNFGPQARLDVDATSTWVVGKNILTLEGFCNGPSQ